MSVNGKTQNLQLGIKGKIVIPIDKQDYDIGILHIHFDIANPIRPKDVGDGGDNRALGIGLEMAYFE